MENNFNEKIDNEFEMMKAEIAQEVMTTLAEKGIDVIANDYDAGAEVAKMIKSYNATMEDIEAKMVHNNETYREDKAKVLNYELHLDRQDLKRETLDKLDNILVKQQRLYEQQVKDKQADPLYKEARTEALGVLNLLKGCDIPIQQLMEVIEPMVQASDTKTLGIAHTLLQGNVTASYAIDRAITGINDMATNSDLVQMIDTMKDYINTGNDGLSYFIYMDKYK